MTSSKKNFMDQEPRANSFTFQSSLERCLGEQDQICAILRKHYTHDPKARINRFQPSKNRDRLAIAIRVSEEVEAQEQACIKAIEEFCVKNGAEQKSGSRRFSIRALADRWDS
ncbi:hypothetical protein MKZ38_002183 [Zalerion maritima]|uniref:Uncharacterized protein n=1 Tax=Zalerion maritima TaxID=339359 RepID=A0AAD5WRG5_9PEZI|nr:hypothetical protein MKZ38_002183 [Zalerion maritima]